jgi:diketogulonate reductase-like aldo/keto reductase
MSDLLINAFRNGAHMDNGLLVISQPANVSRMAENFQIFELSLEAVDLESARQLGGRDGRVKPDTETVWC